MAIAILMPALSPTMTEGNLVKWAKKEGDSIAPGQIIAEIETDKAIMEIESIDYGTIGKIVVQEGVNGVKTGSLIAIILEEGDDQAAMDAVLAKHDVAVAQSLSPSLQSDVPDVIDQAEVASEVSASLPLIDFAADKRIFISPLAKKIAIEKQIDLKNLKGTGPHGRIVKLDVLSYQHQAEKVTSKEVASSSRNAQEYEKIAVTAVRKIISKRLLESKQTIPHFYLNLSCRLDALIALRKQINDSATQDKSGPAYKISINDFIIKAVAKAVQSIPAVNTSWQGDHMVRYNNVDVAVAVSTESGLLTPIIKNADHKGILAISAEMKSLAERARANKLRPEEFQGGSISISNLGMYGIKSFNAIINPPQSCIVAVGAATEQPIVSGGKIEIGTVMDITLSCDHRVLDGAIAAEFAVLLKRFIEEPVIMMI